MMRAFTGSGITITIADVQGNDIGETNFSEELDVINRTIESALFGQEEAQ